MRGLIAETLAETYGGQWDALPDFMQTESDELVRQQVVSGILARYFVEVAKKGRWGQTVYHHETRHAVSKGDVAFLFDLLQNDPHESVTPCRG